MSHNDASLHLSASHGFPEDYRLLELTPEILAQLEASPPSDSLSLVARGRENDVAVLVDLEDHAYQLHTAHTSNSLYLLSREPGPAQQLLLRAKLSQTFELLPTNPQIRARVAEVLAQEPAFRGADFEPKAGVDAVGQATGAISPVTDAIGPVTDAVLRRHVPSGEQLLRRTLADIPAFRHAETGHWRTIDPGYCMELLRLVLATQIERDWALDALDARLVFDALQSDAAASGEVLLPEAIEAVLAKFSNSRQGAPGIYAIEALRVARFLAQQIFAAEGARAWPAPEFLEALQATMPPQLPLSAELADLELWGSANIPASLVRGLAYASTPIDTQLLYTQAGVPAESTLLNPLDRSMLPHDPRVRLGKLFETQSKWLGAEIRPFLEDLVDVDADLLEAGDEKAQITATKTIDTWLLKYARGVKSPDGTMVYSSRFN
ncbi:hypothetical protein GGF46_002526 [Coemansia sp. RSA 552]|nr:hypothetical protein GGF46_002526 [Coemansia sp. RSA 552]